MVNLSNLRLLQKPLTSNFWNRTINISVILLQCVLILWISNYTYSMFKSNYFDLADLEIKPAFGQLSEKKFSRKADIFLRQNNIQGNFFNNLEAGHRLIAQHYPKIKVYIDGRTELYGKVFFKNYIKILDSGDWQLFQEQADEMGITGVFLSFMNKPVVSVFLSKLYLSADWELVYFDYDAIIFLRNIPANKDVIERFSIDLAYYGTPIAGTQFLNNPASKEIYYNRAIVLKGLSLYAQADNEISQVIRIPPASGDEYFLKSELYLAMKKNAQALDSLKITERYQPKSIKVLSALASLYIEENDFDNALEVIGRILSQAPNDPRGYWVQAKLFAQKGEYAKSHEIFSKAIRLNLGVSQILSGVDDLYAKKAYSWAEKICVLALTRNERGNEIYNRLSLIYEAEGNLDKAKESFQKAKELTQ
jgi:tetratricopeptide (TPR) repeat protein